MASQIQDLVVNDLSSIPVTDIISFDYVRKTDVKVKVGTTTSNLVQKTYINEWTITSDNKVQLNASVFPSTGTYKVSIFRQTDATTPSHSFQPGSSIRAEDLNNINKQTLFVAEEVQNSLNSLALGSNPTGEQILINGNNIADDSITSSKILNYEVQTSDIDDLAVTTGKIDNLAVTTGKINNLAVTTEKIADGDVTNVKINGVDGTKVTPDFGSQNIVTTGTLNSGNITSTGAISATTADFSGELNLSGGGDSNRFFDVEIGDANTTSNSFYIRNFTGNNSPNNLAEFKKDGGDSKLIVGKINATQQFIGDGSGLTNLPSSALEGALPSIDGSALTGLTMPLSKVAYIGNPSDYTLPVGQNTFVTAGNGIMTRTVTAQSDDTYIWVQYKLMFSTNTSTSNSNNRAIYKVSLYKNGVFNQDILPEVNVQSNSYSTSTAEETFKFIQTSFSANDSIEVRVLHRSNSTGSSWRGVIKAASYLNVFCVDVN